MLDICQRKLQVNHYPDLIKLVLPEFLVEHFDLVKSRKNKEVLHLYFEERNTTFRNDPRFSLILQKDPKSIPFKTGTKKMSPVFTEDISL